MKNNNWIFIFLGLIVFFFLVFCIVPLFFDYTHKTTEILEYYNVSFLSASALFTGLAFIATFLSLFYQSKSLKVQLNLEVFSKTMHSLMDSDRFRECKKYIYSNQLRVDINEVKIITGKDSINLEDFRKLCSIQEDNECSSDEQIKKRLSISYEMITYFCGKMEYLGLIYQKWGIEVDNLILDYYGRTIIETYRILEPLIANSKNNMYYHYANLYNLAKSIEKDFLTRNNE